MPSKIEDETEQAKRIVREMLRNPLMLRSLLWMALSKLGSMQIDWPTMDKIVNADDSPILFKIEQSGVTIGAHTGSEIQKGAA